MGFEKKQYIFQKLGSHKKRDEKKLDFLKDDLSKSLEYDQVKNDLEQIGLEEVEGIIIRAGIRWRELGEKSTKYFFGLKKRNAAKNTLDVLRMIHGKCLKILLIYSIY